MLNMIFGTVLILLCAGFFARGEECGAPADVVFIIDSSSSIHPDDFKKQINFVEKLVESFDIAPDKTQVAALTFSKRVRGEFPFNPKMTKADIQYKVKAISHAKGLATYTHEGIAEARRLFLPKNGARPGVAKIAILLTDGSSTESEKTLKEAEEAKEENIEIIGIGVGGKVNKPELSRVVSLPVTEHMFITDDFETLMSNKFKDLIALKACEAAKSTTPAPTTTTTITTTTATTTTTTTEKPKPPSTTTPYVPPVSTPGEQNEEEGKTCQNKEADVVFILDMSSSIWEEHFKDQLKFVSEIVDKFDIDSGKTRVGAIAFSDSAEPSFYLNSLKTGAEVRNAILNITSLGGITNTHKALDLLEKMFSSKFGSRPGVAHIAILITDGRSSMPTLTIPAVEKVHDDGVYVFAIGVGNMTDRTELLQMASKPVSNYMFEVNGYKALPIIKNILAYKTCKVPQNDQPKCAEDIQSKILFGMYGVGGSERPAVTEFIKDFGKAFYQAKAEVEIGVMEACKKADIGLTKFSSAESYTEAVQEEVAVPARSFSSFFKSMYSTMPSSGDIVTAEKKQNTVILFVSGDPGINNDAIRIATKFKFIARVMVINIGGNPSSQLGQIASFRNTGMQDKTHFFEVSDTGKLPFLLKKVIGRMCNEQ